jgi:cytidylate kinase
MNCIFLFGGPSKSGKTNLGRRLAQDLRLPFASFGDFVRKEAKRKGLREPSREQLQVTGLSLATTDMAAFCRAVLEDGGFVPGRGLVVDGIRHISAVSTLRALIPDQPVKVVFLESSVEDRVGRSSLSRAQLERLDSHAVESETMAIRNIADLVLNTSGSVDDNFSRLRIWVVQQCTG